MIRFFKKDGKMAKKIFIAATGQHCGKTTTSLSILHCARKKYNRIGFIKPIGPKVTFYKDRFMDVDAALIAGVYGLEDDIEFMSPVVLHKKTTQEVLDGKIPKQTFVDNILRAVSELEKKCDFLIIEGAGHTGVGSVIGMNNAQVAKMVNAPVIIITNGGVGNVIDAVHLNLALFEKENVDVRLVIANKLISSKRDKTLKYLNLAFNDKPFKAIGGFDYSPVLANPTLEHVSKFLDLPIHGNKDEKDRIIHNVMLGGASSQRVVDMMKENSLLVVNTSRDELLVTLASLYNMKNYRKKIVGLVISGKLEIKEVTKQILKESNIPYLRTTEPVRNVFLALMEDVAKISIEDKEKIELIQKTVEKLNLFNDIEEIFS
jgi:BioD-like phosphotransacetylase family protein